MQKNAYDMIRGLVQLQWVFLTKYSTWQSYQLTLLLLLLKLNILEENFCS